MRSTVGEQYGRSEEEMRDTSVREAWREKERKKRDGDNADKIENIRKKNEGKKSVLRDVGGSN